MLLNRFITWILFSIVLIILLYLLNKVLKRNTILSAGTRGATIFFLLVASPVIFYFTLTTVYIIRGKTDYSVYYTLGSPQFKFNDGSSRQLKFSTRHGIVNNSGIPLEYEAVHYSHGFDYEPYGNTPLEISPFSLSSVLHGIDYFVNEKPPKSVLITSSIDSVAHYWLHEKGMVAFDKDTTTETGPPIESIEGTSAAIDFSKVHDSTYDGKLITIEGYVALPEFSFGSSQSMQLDLFERKNQFYPSSGLTLYVNIGTGKNEMDSLPEKYKSEDLVITGNENEKIGVGDHVSITGRISVSSYSTIIKCLKIEKTAEVPVDYSKLNAIRLTPSAITDSTLKGKMVYTEGTIEVPVFTMGGIYTSFDLTIPGFDSTVSLDIVFGSGPSKVEAIPENFSPKDIKIHDKNNKPINIKRKIGVYGIWDGSAIRVENIHNI